MWPGARPPHGDRSALLDEVEIPCERTPQVDVAGQGLDLFAVDENLNGRDRWQVHGQRVDDGVHGQELAVGPAGVSGGDLAAQVDERDTAISQEERAERRAWRHGGDRRLSDGRDLRVRNLTCLLERPVS